MIRIITKNILASIVFGFLLFGCCKKQEAVQLIGDPEPPEPTAVNDDFYLSIDSLSNGESWENDNEQQFFYRILISSSEESVYMDVELIEILEEGNLKFISRHKVLPSVFKLDYYTSKPIILKWSSSNTIKVSINQKDFLLNLQTMKSIQSQ